MAVKAFIKVFKLTFSLVDVRYFWLKVKVDRQIHKTKYLLQESTKSSCNNTENRDKNEVKNTEQSV